MVFAGAPAARRALTGDTGQEPDERRREEQPLGEEREAVLDEHAAEGRPRRRHEAADDPEGQHAGRREPGDPAAVGPTGDEAGREHQEHHDAEAELEAERAHGRTIRASSGTVAVSTGAIARPGTMPKSTSTNTSTTSATHSGPRASSRWGNCGEGGPQKICLATRRT